MNRAGSSIDNIATSEDPINPFSSPEKPTVPAATAPLPFPAFPRTPSPTPVAGPSKPILPEAPALEDDDDDDMPSMLAVLQDAKKSSAASSAKEELRKRKLELLQKQQQARRPLEEDDDDLEVVDSSRAAAVEKLENQHSHKAGKKDISRTRKQQMALAGIRPSKPIGKDKKVETVRREEFDQQVLLKAKMEARAITKQKEEEWKAIGGSVRKEPESGVKSEDVMKALASHALEVVTANAQREEAFEAFGDSGDEDSEDGDYKPDERGSASPEPEAMEEDEDEDKENNDEDFAMGEDAEETLVEDPESEDVRPRAGRHRVIASDDEDEENDENAPPPRPRPRQPFAALGGRDDDEMEIVLDRRSPSTDGATTNDEGTDKENDLTAFRGRQVRFDSPDFDENTPLSLDLAGPRRPLQDISSSAPDTPKPLDLRTNLTQLFEAQLRTPQPSPGPSLQPLLGGALGSKGSEGFSQFSQSDRTLGPSGSSSGDLADLFDATTQKLKDNTWSSPGGGLAEAFVEKVGNRRSLSSLC